MDYQVRGDLLQPIPMDPVRLSGPGFPILRKDSLQCRPAPGNLLEFFILCRMPLDKLIAVARSVSAVQITASIPRDSIRRRFTL